MKNALLSVALTIIYVPLYAFTLATLWRWFLVPLGAPSIGYVHAYGVGVLIALPFTTSLVALLNAMDKPAWELTALGIFVCLMALAVGWICVKAM